MGRQQCPLVPCGLGIVSGSSLATTEHQPSCWARSKECAAGCHRRTSMGRFFRLDLNRLLLWPGPSLPWPRRYLPLKICRSDASGGFLALSRTHSPGQFRSLKVREVRGANDRSQGTADVARRPRALTKSRQRSFINSRRPQASKAVRKSARQRIEVALPTHCRPRRFSGRLTVPPLKADIARHPRFATKFQKLPLNET